LYLVEEWRYQNPLQGSYLCPHKITVKAVSI